MNEPTKPYVETGKTYNVNHSRKGKFALSVTKVDEDWVTGRLVAGTPYYLNHYNEKDIGESMTVRISFCTFTELKQEKDHG